MKILSNILVSIIINNYNYADYLSDAIESVLSQKYGNVELIIVDDGSTDSSRLIMDKYKEKAILCYKENGGQASAFNLGFKHAKGELVQFLDADDYLYPNAIERIVQVYEKNKDQKIGRIMFNLDYYNTDHPEIVLGTFIKKKMTTQKYRSLLANTHDCLATPTSGECFTRDGLKSIFPMEETEWRICADMYVINWMTFWGEVIVITESLGRYRIHGNNNWASNVVTLESLKRDWEWAERKEKLINKILIANDMKRRWGAYILDMRAWLILIKTGELLADNMSQYAIKIIVSIFYSALSKPKKFFYFFWFFIVAILPMKNRKICNFVLNNYSLESIKKNIHFYA